MWTQLTLIQELKLSVHVFCADDNKIIFHNTLVTWDAGERRGTQKWWGVLFIYEKKKHTGAVTQISHEGRQITAPKKKINKKKTMVSQYGYVPHAHLWWRKRNTNAPGRIIYRMKWVWNLTNAAGAKGALTLRFSLSANVRSVKNTFNTQQD